MLDFPVFSNSRFCAATNVAHAPKLSLVVGHHWPSGHVNASALPHRTAHAARIRNRNPYHPYPGSGRAGTHFPFICACTLLAWAIKSLNVHIVCFLSIRNAQQEHSLLRRFAPKLSLVVQHSNRQEFAAPSAPLPLD
jgi:hypothetical protein